MQQTRHESSLTGPKDPTRVVHAALHTILLLLLLHVAPISISTGTTKSYFIHRTTPRKRRGKSRNERRTHPPPSRRFCVDNGETSWVATFVVWFVGLPGITETFRRSTFITSSAALAAALGVTGECLWLTDVRALATSHEARNNPRQSKPTAAVCLSS